MSQGKDGPIFHGDFGALSKYIEATDNGKPDDMDDNEGAAEWLGGLMSVLGHDPEPNKPEQGKQYRLTGGKDTPSIANGKSRAEGEGADEGTKEII